MPLFDWLKEHMLYPYPRPPSRCPAAAPRRPPSHYRTIVVATKKANILEG
jgi:hypothetical protein